MQKIHTVLTSDGTSKHRRVVSSEISGRKFPEIYSTLLITYVNQLFPSPTLQSDTVNNIYLVFTLYGLASQASTFDQQGPGLSGLIHKEAHPVAPYRLYEILKSMLDASTAPCSSAFHLLITLFEKKYLVISLVLRCTWPS